MKVRLLASTGDDPVAALATDLTSSLVVTGRVGGPMPVGAPNELLPAATGGTAYVLRYTQTDELAFAARLQAPKLVTRRLTTGPDGSIYVLGEADALRAGGFRPRRSVADVGRHRHGPSGPRHEDADGERDVGRHRHGPSGPRGSSTGKGQVQHRPAATAEWPAATRSRVAAGHSPPLPPAARHPARTDPQ